MTEQERKYLLALAFVEKMDGQLRQTYLPCPRDVFGNELRALDEVVRAVLDGRYPPREATPLDPPIRGELAVAA